jgi:DNA-binding response OmpR family regulator
MEPKKKILIVEDEQPLVDLLSSRLMQEGYDVDYSNNGEDGCKKMNEWKPDLILLDIVMPKMDGYEVLEKMNEGKNKTPVIVISNSGQPVEIEKTKKLGAVDHLVKTEFSPEDVLKKIKSNFEDKKAGAKEAEKIKPIESETDNKNGIKVMLVEDDTFLREICGKKLDKEGFTVYEAIDGEQAVANVEDVQPDIVLLDIILPAIDGFQVLEKIRKIKGTVGKTPVIMLSNLGQEDDIKKAMDMGANDYLVKAHFTTEEIVEKIKKILDK